jgi:hypothetical protein
MPDSWNQPTDNPDDARALQAVQVALDRRDNGGDARTAGEDWTP